MIWPVAVSGKRRKESNSRAKMGDDAKPRRAGRKCRYQNIESTLQADVLSVLATQLCRAVYSCSPWTANLS